MLLGILVCIQLVLAIALICMIFIQKGSSGMGSLGGASSNTVFGSGGSFSFLFKLTAVLSILFFLNSMLLTHQVRVGRQSGLGAAAQPAGLSAGGGKSTSGQK